MAQRRSSFGRSGNRLQQLYALSGRATLADLPFLYGLPGGLAGGGQEKGGAAMGDFGGMPPLAPDVGAGPGSGGSFLSPVSQIGSSLPGPFPADPNGASPSAFNPAFPRQGGGGEGGNQDTAGQRAAGLLGRGYADLTLNNLATALNAGLNIASATGPLGLGVGLAGEELGLIPEGTTLPSYEGYVDIKSYLTDEEIRQLDLAATPQQAQQIANELTQRARERQAADSDRGLFSDAMVADRTRRRMDQLNNRIASGFFGDAVSGVGAAAGQAGSPRNALAEAVRGAAQQGYGAYGDVGATRRNAGRDRNAGGRGGIGGGVGSGRARGADRAPGGPRGGVAP